MNDQPRWLDIEDQLYPQIYLMKQVIFQNISINQLTEYHIEMKYNSFRRQIDLTPLILKYFIENRSLFIYPPSLNNGYEILIRDQFQENVHFLGLFPHDNSYTIGQNFLSSQILYILVKREEDFIQMANIPSRQKQDKKDLHTLLVDKQMENNSLPKQIENNSLPKQIENITLPKQIKYKNELYEQNQVNSVDQLTQLNRIHGYQDLQFLQDYKKNQNQKQLLDQKQDLQQKQEQYDNSNEKIYQYQQNEKEFQDQDIQKHAKSSKRKTIQEILKIVAEWRKLILTKKIPSIEASYSVKMSKRSLQDYFTIIKLGQKYEFDFQHNMKNGFGELRNFVKNNHQTKQSSKIKILQKFKLFKK